MIIMLNFLFFIWSGESISHVALSFRLSFNFTESLSLAYPLRLMKFSARDFNFQSLAEPIDVSFYMYMIEEVKILTTFIDVSKLDARLVLGAYSIEFWILCGANKLAFFKTCILNVVVLEKCVNKDNYILLGTQLMRIWNILWSLYRKCVILF